MLFFLTHGVLSNSITAARFRAIVFTQTHTHTQQQQHSLNGNYILAVDSSPAQLNSSQTLKLLDIFITSNSSILLFLLILSAVMLVLGLRRSALAYIVKAINLTNTSIFPAKRNEFSVIVTSVSLRTGSSQQCCFSV